MHKEHIVRKKRNKKNHEKLSCAYEPRTYENLELIWQIYTIKLMRL